ncbi:MAG: DUF2782 domain-containing protein [Xanthomonadales bacterium]|nr:DUF2782 domain-containing protein [Xanthomonadales bacterium]MCB1628333.1 DUF2782 domain-containing protein [Xanthomonadales bacterium]
MNHNRLLLPAILVALHAAALSAQTETDAGAADAAASTSTDVAEDLPELAPAPAPPPLDLNDLPPKAEPQDALVPEITIRTSEEGHRVEEYRENGRLLYVRVVPVKGVPYTLIDADGDGEVDRPRPMSNEVLPVFYDLRDLTPKGKDGD